VPGGTTTYEYLDVVFNQSFGMVAANDQPAKHVGGSQWSVKTSVWAAAIPEGRTPYSALLLEGHASTADRFTIGLLELEPARHIAER
jgi:hypothetical protein